MKGIKLGKRVIPAWLIATLIFSGTCLSILSSNVWESVTIPFEVKEPLEILSYTSGVSLFPGETQELLATIRNNSPNNYSVQLSFQLSDIAYQHSFVTFSDETYQVTPGEQVLAGWVSIAPCAPAIYTELTIEFKRVCEIPSQPIMIFEENFNSAWIANRGSSYTESGWMVCLTQSDEPYRFSANQTGSFGNYNSSKTLEIKLQVDNWGTYEGTFGANIQIIFYGPEVGIDPTSQFRHLLIICPDRILWKAQTDPMLFDTFYYNVDEGTEYTFFALINEPGNTITLYVKDPTDLQLLGHSMPRLDSPALSPPKVELDIYSITGVVRFDYCYIYNGLKYPE